MSLLRQMMYSMGVDAGSAVIPKGNAIKFTGASGQSTQSLGSATLGNNFTLKQWVRFTGFGSQYIVTAGSIFSIIFSFTGQDWPDEGRYLELYGGIPRTPFTLTPINNTNWHYIEAGLKDGFLWAKVDGVAGFAPVAYSGSILFTSEMLLGGGGGDGSRATAEVDNLELYINDILTHRYTFNEDSGDYLDDISGAHFPTSTATRVISTIPDDIY